MINRADLLASIRGGESGKLEFKEVVVRGGRVAFGGKKRRASSDLAEVFVSMANTQGGEVVFGVRDSDRAVVGIEPTHRDTVEQFVVNVAVDSCEPTIVPGLEWVFLPGEDGTERLCLLVTIPRSLRQVHRTNEGRYLERIGTHRRLISADRLSQFLVERGQPIAFELWPAQRARLEDLDSNLLGNHYRGRFPDWTPPDDWTDTPGRYVLAVKTDEGPVPTNAGVLMFTPRPDAFLPSAFIEMVSYRHDYPDGNSADSTRITGPLSSQIPDAVRYLEFSPLNPTVSVKRDDGRHDYPAYSLRALQEAVVNAVVHRDYAAPSQIIIRVFPDRIEFRNPGAPHNGLTVADLYTGSMPQRRNDTIVGFFRYYKSPVTGGVYMESRGEGFMNIVRESQRISGRRPELKIVGDTTQLTIFAGSPPVEAEDPSDTGSLTEHREVHDGNP